VVVREDVLVPITQAHVLRGRYRDPFGAGGAVAFTEERAALRPERPQQIVGPVIGSPGSALLLAVALHGHSFLPAARLAGQVKEVSERFGASSLPRRALHVARRHISSTPYVVSA
jgi:hypothetical protein